MKTAYIVGGYRTAVGKSGKGLFKFTRPDDLAADVVKHLMKDFPNLDPERIDDVIVGNATPEAEQGLNIGRMISLMGLNTEKVPGMTVNRYCSSGLQTIALAANQIQAGAAAADERRAVSEGQDSRKEANPEEKPEPEGEEVGEERGGPRKLEQDRLQRGQRVQSARPVPEARFVRGRD